MKQDQAIYNAGLQIVKELMKELPRSVNRQQRDLFKRDLRSSIAVSKEILEYEEGVFTKATTVEEIAETTELESYMEQMLPEGVTSGKLGLMVFNVGTFLIGFVKLNPTTVDSEVHYFYSAPATHSYLAEQLKNGYLDRLIKKHASFLLPSIVVDTSQGNLLESLTPEELNEAINSGKGIFVNLSEEEAEKLGFKESEGIKLDPVTQKRIEKQAIDSSALNLSVSADSK